jgi:predicted PurR-regulated permease PerM
VSAIDPLATVQTIKVKSAGTFLISLGCAVALLYFGRTLLITLLCAVIISFILDPAVRFFVRMQMPRVFASFLVCSLALLILYLVGLGSYVQLSGLADDLPSYGLKFNDMADKITEEIDGMEKSTYKILLPKRAEELEKAAAQQAAASRTRKRPAEPVLPPAVQEVRIRQDRSPVVAYLYSNLSEFYTALLMASFVPFLVYFMLSWRDHMQKSFLLLFKGVDQSVARGTLQGIADMARAYVVGNFILGILLSVVSCLFFWFVKIPYWPLIGLLSGFLSLVPYIGLPLAIVPPFLAAVTVYNNLTAYLVIGTTIAFFHLLALNLLYPKLVGSRVHLNPLVVTIALMVWGTLWGGIGLLLAIPITAGIKTVCDNVPGLEPYGRMMGD